MRACGRFILLYFIFNITCFASDVGLQKYSEDTLIDYLFRYKILVRDYEADTVSVNPTVVSTNKQSLNQIWNQLKESNFPSPFTTNVYYSDAFKTKFNNIQINGIGSHNQAHFNSLIDYLTAIAHETDVMVKNGYQPMALNFTQVQTFDTFIQRTTLAQEVVRICGFTQEAENLLLIRIQDFFKRHDLKLMALYYYGSRVMPRSEVVARDSRFLKTMPVVDDGVKKNAVRIKGITQISDLETIALVETTSSRDLKAVGKLFRDEFEKIYREFPVTLKIIGTLPGNTESDPFDLINQHQKENKPRAPHQFIRAL